MAREQIIKKLKDILKESTKTDDSVCYVTSDDADALKLAIKALEQQPCENTISRQEIIYELNRLGRNAFKDDTDYDNFFAFVDNLPPVTPQPKTGHWIHGHCGVDDYIKCSECHKEVVQNIVTLEGDLPEDAFSLCPFCGTRMVEPQESEG